MKLLVETTGAFMLLDRSQSVEIAENRPTVVESNHFVQNKIAVKQINVLGKVNDAGSDKEFEAFWQESEDAGLAVRAFLGSFAVEDETQKASKPPTKANKTKVSRASSEAKSSE